MFYFLIPRSRSVVKFLLSLVWCVLQLRGFQRVKDFFNSIVELGRVCLMGQHHEMFNSFTVICDTYLMRSFFFPDFTFPLVTFGEFIPLDKSSVTWS